MLVRVMVGADMHPMKADVLKDQTGLPALGPCLQSKIQKWDLTSLQAAQGDQVVFPLVFKPEPLAKGEKRMLVPMSAQETEGPQRFLIDDQSVGEAPLASVSMLTLSPNATSQAKARKDDEEEIVIYVLEGGFKVGPTCSGPAMRCGWARTPTSRQSRPPTRSRSSCSRFARTAKARGRRWCTAPTLEDLQDRRRQGDGEAAARRHGRQARRRRDRRRRRARRSRRTSISRRTRSSSS